VLDSEPELAELESNENLLQARAAALARSGQSLGVLSPKRSVEKLQVNTLSSLGDRFVAAARAAEEQRACQAIRAASQAV
jgi:hypothetical protein